MNFIRRMARKSVAYTPNEHVDFTGRMARKSIAYTPADKKNIAHADMPTDRDVDVILSALVLDLARMEQCKNSPVKSLKTEQDVLVQLEALRDAMEALLTDPDRTRVLGIFGGDCKRLARVKALCECISEERPKYANERRLQSCLNTCTTIEAIIKQKGWTTGRLRRAVADERRQLRANDDGAHDACIDHTADASVAEAEAHTLECMGETAAAIQKYEECKRSLDAAAKAAPKDTEDGECLDNHRQDIQTRIRYLKDAERLHPHAPLAVDISEHVRPVDLPMHRNMKLNHKLMCAIGVRAVSRIAQSRAICEKHLEAVDVQVAEKAARLAEKAATKPPPPVDSGAEIVKPGTEEEGDARSRMSRMLIAELRSGRLSSAMERARPESQYAERAAAAATLAAMLPSGSRGSAGGQKRGDEHHHFRACLQACGAVEKVLHDLGLEQHLESATQQERQALQDPHVHESLQHVRLASDMQREAERLAREGDIDRAMEAYTECKRLVNAAATVAKAEHLFRLAARRASARRSIASVSSKEPGGAVAAGGMAVSEKDVTVLEDFERRLDSRMAALSNPSSNAAGAADVRAIGNDGSEDDSAHLIDPERLEMSSESHRQRVVCAMAALGAAGGLIVLGPVGITAGVTAAILGGAGLGLTAGVVPEDSTIYKFGDTIGAEAEKVEVAMHSRRHNTTQEGVIDIADFLDCGTKPVAAPTISLEGATAAAQSASPSSGATAASALHAKRIAAHEHPQGVKGAAADMSGGIWAFFSR